MHFDVMILVFLSNCISQNSYSKRKKKEPLIYNESSFPNLIKPPLKKLRLEFS